MKLMNEIIRVSEETGFSTDLVIFIGIAQAFLTGICIPVLISLVSDLVAFVGKLVKAKLNPPPAARD